jgi:L-2-hydroxyglutarate oxidase LhgO
VTAVAGLWSPDSGIVDAHAYTDSFEAELDALGGMVIYQTEVSGLERRGDAWRVHTKGSRGEAFALDVPCVLNSAGLGSDRMAALAGVDVDEAGWRLHPCKGDYFSVAPALGRLVSHLIYPVPAGPGLGIHVTLDLAGRIRLGPDAHYVSEISYGVDPSGARRFTEAVSRYLPGIELDQVAPEMAGIRPKLQGPGDPFRDFVIAESSDHGAPGIVHLIGIESPGLTASAAIARRAADLVLDLL